MKLVSSLLLSILLLNACSSSKRWIGTSRNWTGASNLNGTKAKFDELNGKQAFTLLVPDNDTYLKYYLKVNSGKLETSIKSPKEMILNKESIDMVTDSIHVVNQRGSKYKIYLNGDQASGEFDIRFTDTAN